MKTLKTLLLSLAFSAMAFSQSGNVSTFNFGSQSPIRQVLPISNMPPAVQVWIYDPAGSDAYSITLSYHGTDGMAHVVSQYAASGGANTVLVIQVDAASIDGVKVMPLKFTGASFQSPQ